MLEVYKIIVVKFTMKIEKASPFGPVASQIVMLLIRNELSTFSTIFDP